jgi:lysophospholipase L1-like esterase
MTKTTKWILYVFILTIVTVVFAEAALRIYNMLFTTEGQFRYVCTYDPYTGYFNKPNLRYHIKKNGYDFYYDTDKDGIRGSRRPLEKKNEYRILVLGDSCTYGFGINSNRTYSALLEDKLIKKYRRNIRVINAGVPGFDTKQEVAYLKHYGMKYRPDLVVIAFMNNDLEGNLFSIVYLNGFLQQDPIEIYGHTSFIVEFFDKVILPKSGLKRKKAFDETKILNKADALFREAREFCKKNSIELMVFEIPTWNYTKFNNEDSSRHSVYHPLRVRNNILELYVPFNRLKRNPYLSDKSHPNSYGHSVIASILENEISRRSYIEKKQLPNRRKRFTSDFF